jgi:hypothetical protein
MTGKNAFILSGAILLSCIAACTLGPEISDGQTLSTRAGNGRPIAVEFTRGSAWMKEAKMGFLKLRITPQLAVWAEDSAGMVATLFVTRAFAKQDWRLAKFHPDTCGRPMCMPYWLNRLVAKGLPVPTKNHPLSDAVTGATPKGSFTLGTALPEGFRKFQLFVEINKSFDNNDTWPAKKDHSSFNGQPAVVYAATVNLDDTAAKSWVLSPKGMSGERGNDPALYPIDKRLTTALEMLEKVTVRRR